MQSGTLATAVRNLWRKQRPLFLAFVAALVVTVFFGARLLVFSLYWPDPDHHEPPVKGWMTPRYVAHSYDLPPATVREALELKALDGERRTLAEITKTSSLTLEEIQRRVDEAVRSHEGGGQ